jgi:hypothetical protein
VLPPSNFSRGSNCSPSSFSSAIALRAFRTRITVPRLRTGDLAEIARRRLRRIREIKDIKESGSVFISYLTALGAEIGLCTSSRERLGTYFAEPTQRRVRIAGVKRGSGGSWRRSRESLRLRPPLSVGRVRLLKDRWLRAREMLAMRIRRSYIKNSRKKEEGKSGLRWLEGSRKTKAQFICCLPATIPSNSPTERQRTTYNTQSPSALVE